jgi:hypothetical protein
MAVKRQYFPQDEVKDNKTGFTMVAKPVTVPDFVYVTEPFN